MTKATLLEPFQLGPLRLPNRIVMAPLTRSRATAVGDVLPIHATYYAQRATAGLIVTESCWVSPQGRGFAWTPGIHNSDQIHAWQNVTNAVHSAGGRIFLQLWHVGRCSHPDLQPDGGQPVAPSALEPGMNVFTETGFKPAPTPRALGRDELPGIVDEFSLAARNAKEAGFDGVEIHSANGYLLHQFLSDESNRRTDEYGGSIENRIRFPLDVVNAVLDVWGPERTGIRISPTSFLKNCGDSDPQSLYARYVSELSDRKLAYLHVIEGTIYAERDPMAFKAWDLKQHFHGPYIGNNAYTPALAETRIAEGLTDLVSFGRPYIANPDLVERFAVNADLAEADPETFYGGDAKGYTDYPSMSQLQV